MPQIIWRFLPPEQSPDARADEFGKPIHGPRSENIVNDAVANAESGTHGNCPAEA
jgi:hypothetical protein